MRDDQNIGMYMNNSNQFPSFPMQANAPTFSTSFGPTAGFCQPGSGWGSMPPTQGPFSMGALGGYGSPQPVVSSPAFSLGNGGVVGQALAPMAIRSAHDPSDVAAVHIPNSKLKARPVYFVDQAESDYTAEERALMDTKSRTWVPKGWATVPEKVKKNGWSASWGSNLARAADSIKNLCSDGDPDIESVKLHLLEQIASVLTTGPPLAQRCPRTTVDSLTFVPCINTNGQPELGLVMGEFDKKMPNGTPVHGWAIAAGGHYESTGRGPPGLEKGDVCVRAAADKEMKEEIRISAEHVLVQQHIAIVDHLNDPRFPCVRHVFFRLASVNPAASEELKHVVVVPLSLLQGLCNGQYGYPNPKNQAERLPVVLNHDRLILAVMSLPTAGEFIRNATGMLAQQQSRAMGQFQS